MPLRRIHRAPPRPHPARLAQGGGHAVPLRLRRRRRCHDGRPHRAQGQVRERSNRGRHLQRFHDQRRLHAVRHRQARALSTVQASVRRRHGVRRTRGWCSRGRRQEPHPHPQAAQEPGDQHAVRGAQGRRAGPRQVAAGGHGDVQIRARDHDQRGPHGDADGGGEDRVRGVIPGAGVQVQRSDAEGGDRRTGFVRVRRRMPEEG